MFSHLAYHTPTNLYPPFPIDRRRCVHSPLPCPPHLLGHAALVRDLHCARRCPPIRGVVHDLRAALANPTQEDRVVRRRVLYRSSFLELRPVLLLHGLVRVFYCSSALLWEPAHCKLRLKVLHTSFCLLFARVGRGWLIDPSCAQRIPFAHFLAADLRAAEVAASVTLGNVISTSRTGTRLTCILPCDPVRTRRCMPYSLPS